MNQVKVLDHGYLKYIEHWGSDERIVEAARMSNSKGFRSWAPYRECILCGVWKLYPEEDGECLNGLHSWREVPKGDVGLMEYLWKNKHVTPFEMGGMTIEVQAPIMVFREWHRHRTQSYNEMSARYTPLPDVNYLPTVQRCMVVVGKNKQAGVIAGADELTHDSALEWLKEIEDAYIHCEKVYQSGLKRGIPKELARLCVPVGRYSRMMASANLRNWLAFLTLRMDKAAQEEIRMFANAVGDLIKENFPKTWNLFVESRSK
jgi:thymidylate synthase (FAD)